MKILLIVISALTVLAAPIVAIASEPKIAYNEKYYNKQHCESINGTIEYKLKDQTRVDCLTM